jgi:hypothetical protein
MRYIIGFLVTIGLIILILVLLLRGGGGNSQPAVKALDVSIYSTNQSSQAEYLIDGPIQADSTHRQLKIDVSEQDVTLTTYSGYQQTVLHSETLPNNQAAYSTFLRALQLQAFTKGDTNKALADERGVCPTGNRYIMSFSSDNKQQLRFWTTTCGGGSFLGNFSGISYLFTGQVPDYSAQANAINF